MAGLRANVVVPENDVEETSVETETAVVATAVNEVAVLPENGPVPSLADLQDKWNTDEVGNVFPRVVGSNGALMVAGISLGDYADVQVYSHNSRTMIVPIAEVAGDPNVKRNCRASYDHKTVFDRESGESIPIPDYIESLKGMFPKGAKVSKYHDIHCTVISSHKNFAAAKEKAVIMQVSVSPTAVKDWFAYIKTAKFRELQGSVPATHRSCVRLVADPRSKGDQNYIAIVFQPVPLEVLANYTPILE